MGLRKHILSDRSLAGQPYREAVQFNLPDDPVLLQQMMRAALAEIERQRLIIAALQRKQ